MPLPSPRNLGRTPQSPVDSGLGVGHTLDPADQLCGAERVPSGWGSAPEQRGLADTFRKHWIDGETCSPGLYESDGLGTICSNFP